MSFKVICREARPERRNPEWMSGFPVDKFWPDFGRLIKQAAEYGHRFPYENEWKAEIMNKIVGQLQAEDPGKTVLSYDLGDYIIVYTEGDEAHNKALDERFKKWQGGGCDVQ